MSHKHTLEGEGFQAEVKVPEEGSGDYWTAKVRLEDEGQRGKHIVMSGYDAEELAGELGQFANAFAQVQAKVQELGQPPAPEQPQASEESFGLARGSDELLG